MDLLALSQSEAGIVLIMIVLVALPFGAIAFAGGWSRSLEEMGKDSFSMDTQGRPGDQAAQDGLTGAGASAVQEDEIRQLVEASSYRRERRGEKPLDTEKEVARLLAQARQDAAATMNSDKALRAEVRSLVIARNERLARQGKQELDVDREVERRMAELADLEA